MNNQFKTSTMKYIICFKTSIILAPRSWEIHFQLCKKLVKFWNWFVAAAINFRIAPKWIFNRDINFLIKSWDILYIMQAARFGNGGINSHWTKFDKTPTNWDTNFCVTRIMLEFFCNYIKVLINFILKELKSVNWIDLNNGLYKDRFAIKNWVVFSNQDVLIWDIGSVDRFQSDNELNVNWIETLPSYKNRRKWIFNRKI